MTPEQFIAVWKDNKLSERGGAQAHFDDLCDLLGVGKPRDRENYCFERGAKKAAGGDGWADVWKRGHFGWENKKPGRDLNAALKQLTDYALQLDNPPLLIVCDRERIVIHTAFTGYPDEPREIRIEQLIEPEFRQLLKWVFTDPEKLRPEKSTAAITAEAAGQFAQLAAAMRSRGDEGQKVAHFLVQCLFCMFAEDEQLLPAGIFTDLLKNAGSDADKAGRRIEKLFTAMQKKGGDYGDHDIAWFNGGLFKNIEIPALTAADLQALHRAAADMDWRAIDPTIFGTLFERGLDPAARAPLGAHYTDTGTIAKLIEPLVSEPLAAEWAKVRPQLAAGQGKGPKSKEGKAARAAYQSFLLRLNHYRVLDPACGSGNFLYLALKALRDIEKCAHVDAQELGLGAELSMQTGPHNMRSELGADYVETLRKTFDGRVPGGADLVTYWFEKARAQIAAGKLQAAGLVSTNSIRGGANRKVLERIVETTRIFEAWSDEEWVNDGAAVRVSLLGFGPIFPVDRGNRLDGLEVATIHADLTAAEGLDLTKAKPQPSNADSTYFGLCLAGDFRVTGEVARHWLTLPNPNGRPNSDVVRPIYNGSDVTGRWADRWVVDFGPHMTEAEAALYEAPFSHVQQNVKDIRLANREKSRAEFWWRLGRSRPELRSKLREVSCFIATVETAKHRVFVWFPKAIAPEHKLVVIPSQSEVVFGMLSSRFHVVWAVRVGGRLGVGNDPVYTTSVCFDKFPFPAGLTPRDTAPVAGQASPPCLADEIVAANIAAAARRLNELREAWLNPAEWVDWVITPEEEKAGFPKRPVAKPGHEADLKKRTLTNLYNARPAWLELAHKALDKAVAEAYNWPDYTPEMPDDEILRRLLALNLERSQSSHVE